MSALSYKDFKDIIEYLQHTPDVLEDRFLFFESRGIYSESAIQSLVDLVASGKKAVTSMDKIFAESGSLSLEDVIKYANNARTFIEHHKFAPPLLVKEFPSDKIEDFSQATWAPITKTDFFKNADYEGRKLALRLGCIYGVFENDHEASNRLSMLINTIQGKTPEDFVHYAGLEMQYDSQFFKFIKENSVDISNMNIQKIQAQWEKISRCVDLKTPENVQRYMDVFNSKKGNEFDTYMAYHNVPENKIRKYKVIYDQMKGRTKTSLPTVKGTAEKGFSYEILDFADINVMRFGEKVKCCQRLGNNAETSMINSAIESTSRVLMVRDENGKPVAGSFVTHTIGDNGKSYVCFDSIEVNASKLPVKAVAFSKTMKRIDKLVKKGVIPSAELSDIETYFEQNPGQRNIRKKDIDALKINQKIREAYKVAMADMMVEDERIRKQQLEAGELTREEYNQVLMKNGRVTVGRNPVSMYLSDLPKVDKKEQEMLPALKKDRSIYRKAHQKTLNGATKAIAKTLTATSIGLGTLMMFTGAPIPGAMLVTYGVAGQLKIKDKKVNHTYTDAFEQRVLYDGRKDSEPSIHSKEHIQEKLVYSQIKGIAKPVKIAELTPEQRKRFRRLREEAGKTDFTQDDMNRYVIGNGQNWCATISREGESLTVNDIVTSSSFLLKRKESKMADAQVELMTTLRTLAEHAESITYECDNPKINKYLSRSIQTKAKEQTRERTTEREIDH